MSEAAKLEIVKDKPKRVIKPKVEQVLPTHIVDVWRLVERSIRDGKQPYPDCTEDSPEVIRSHLFCYLQQPTFFGMLARIGKRPVGILLGHIAQRPYGRPSKYAFIFCMWVDPAFRKNSIGHILWDQYSGALKKNNIYHWESQMTPELLSYLNKENGVEASVLQYIVGGKI